MCIRDSSYGSSFAEKLSVNGKDDSGIQKGQKKIIKSERSSEFTNSRVVQQTAKWRNTKYQLDSNWRQWGIEPTICGDFNGAASGLHSNRRERIKLLGNGLLPQCAAIPLQRVLDLENES